MLERLRARNFKRLGDVEIELGNPVVFIGPNNSGKTSALQALALWEAGVRRWTERWKDTTTPKRPGVTINRRDLVSIPLPNARLLWRDLRVRDVQRINGRQLTDNVYIDITVEGVSEGKPWECGLEFYYANEESFYCRPLRLSDAADSERMPIPPAAAKVRVAFLPPMSGLASNEIRLDAGATNVRIGEGRTAEVLRNLCYRVREENAKAWEDNCGRIRQLFGVDLEVPRYVAERGEISMAYREGGHHFDLAASGRGLQQTLLLLAYMHGNPGAVLMLDEPDAHLEILRQRQVYKMLVASSRQSSTQLLIASHSEALLNEAADRDVVVSFVGAPHRMNDRGAQTLKALRDIGFEDYYQAEQNGWVLYLEGSTDLAILDAFAKTLGHQAAIQALEGPFVHYIGNQFSEAQRHFHGLREAVPHLKGFTLLDRPAGASWLGDPMLPSHAWSRNEIESYLCQRETLEAYAAASAFEDYGPLFQTIQTAESERRIQVMRETIAEVEQALATVGDPSPWGPDLKVSDRFLTPLFRSFFQKLELSNTMEKTNFHVLAELVRPEDIDSEVVEVLDRIGELSDHH